MAILNVSNVPILINLNPFFRHRFIIFQQMEPLFPASEVQHEAPISEVKQADARFTQEVSDKILKSPILEKRVMSSSPGPFVSHAYSYFVEIAAGSHATCIKCHAKINKNALRLAYSTGISGSGHWHHLECFYFNRKMKDDDISCELFKGYLALMGPNKINFQQRIEKLKSGQIKKKRGSMKKGVEEDISPEDPSKYKKTGFTDKERKEFEQHKREYSKLTVKELQNILTEDKMPKTGTKEELLERLAQIKIIGNIPRCPECRYGKMNFNRYDGTFKCRGFYNTQLYYYEKCGRKFKRDELPELVKKSQEKHKNGDSYDDDLYDCFKYLPRQYGGFGYGCYD